MKTSVRLRESINQTIQQTGQTLEAQWIATSYALRKRIHEMEQTKLELEWQQEKVRFRPSIVCCKECQMFNNLFPAIHTHTHTHAHRLRKRLLRLSLR